MRFGMLGPLAVWTADGQQVRVPELKVRTLLAALLAHDGRPVSADRLIDDLWERRLPTNPTGALQAKVSQLRRALDEAQPGGRTLVVSRAPGYALEVPPDAVDARRFQGLAARARATEDLRARADLLSDALALWRGPALADFADTEFARPVIARLGELHTLALEEHAETRLDLGEHHPLVGELAALVARHPLRERLRAAHILALHRAGRQREALASYEDLRRHLAEELGLDPSPDLTGLHQAVLEQDPGLALPRRPEHPAARPFAGQPIAAQPPTARTPVPTWASTEAPVTEPQSVSPPMSPPVPLTNLPAPLTDLIGRGSAVEQVLSRLRSARLVTLTGPGGVGKTRLALEAAAQSLRSFPDGVWVVELIGLGGADGRPGSGYGLAGCAEAVSAVLGIRDDPAAGTGSPPGAPVSFVDRVAAALRPKRMLLVLDNCEHVVDGVAELAETLLRTAPDLRILTTSQEPLGVSGEALWSVPPLSLPDPSVEVTPSVVEVSSAARLFLARAAAAAPDFTLDAENAHAVATVCRRLDGLPLALELAATRVRVLGVHELAERLDDRFRLLAAGKRGAPSRHRTLRAMIDWSWELLTESERTVLRRLAVHADGCTLEAAETVCTGEGVREEDVPHLLFDLVDRSLVVTVEGAAGTRYRLLESVAAYGVERLHQADEFDRVTRRHDRYYLRLAERAEPHLYGPNQRQWLELLDDEAANLRSALDHAVRRADTDPALRLVNALAWYWYLRGRTGEAVRSLAGALSLSDGATDLRARAGAWHAGFRLLAAEAPYPPGQRRSDMSSYAGIGDPRARARAQWFLGFAGWGTGDLGSSAFQVEQALSALSAVGDRWGEAAALSTSAVQAMLMRGDLRGARRDAERSAALFRRLGDRWGELQATDALGMVAETIGDYERAGGLHREGADIAEELGLWSELSAKLSQLGRVQLLRGDHRRAEDLHLRALRLAEEQSDVRKQEYAELGLALVARREGRLDVAESRLRAWVEWCRQVEGQPGLALMLAELGFIAEQKGDAERALELHVEGCGAALSTGDPRAIALALEGVAGARALTGHPRHAAELLGAAAAAREAIGAPLPSAERGDVDRISESVREELGEEAFAASVRRGTALSAEACASDLVRSAAA
ncbi:putative ATPase/DNA-binding SARP family transcriptional activator [Nocardiopsis mwathae]|uniref:Putative ATPase/DNA-binding SARP family transcriptional activator n=1 Tax=Nocardiopsis mwathae TaxID=1472723 RepID=A0A7X0D4H2_9ACTN|nr:BTAD domain-containing putative transcriptional regulator [Nocardiopsis mwathae]MBB6171095.1 putative ATPase/DNA-binding SARP family transcriptional activator [Nocardiopsis mwathae]